jgi:menaquinone-dependent protoporphyrinogen IX oxidase
MGGITDVFDVRENPDPKKYDHIVVGGSIRSHAVSKEMQDYLAKNKGALKDKIRGFFCVQQQTMPAVISEGNYCPTGMLRESLLSIKPDRY